MEPSIGELVFSGVKLMFIGMGIVFLFLTLLVWVISTTSKLFQRYSPESAHPAVPSVNLNAGAENDAELIAAITAAIHQHQNP
jgi:oxaloacetate decarboxylase gamma subunit